MIMNIPVRQRRTLRNLGPATGVDPTGSQRAGKSDAHKHCSILAGPVHPDVHRIRGVSREVTINYYQSKLLSENIEAA